MHARLLQITLCRRFHDFATSDRASREGNFIDIFMQSKRRTSNRAEGWDGVDNARREPVKNSD